MPDGNIHDARACLGVDDQGDELIVVRAERARGDVSCREISASDPAFVEALRKHTPVVGALSPSESFTRWIETPFSSLKKARKVLPTLLDVQLPFALETCATVFLEESRTPRSATRALAVGARESDIEKKLEEFRKKDLDPLVLDHEGLAVWTQSLRECPPTEKNMRDLRVIVCLEKRRLTVTLGRGRMFLGAHVLRQRDAARVSRCLRTHAADGASEEDGAQQSRVRWMWTGAEAEAEGAVADFRARLEKDWPGTSSFHAKPRAFLARALATRALLGGPLRCNLRTGSFTHPALIRKQLRRQVRAALILLCSGLLLCGGNSGARIIAQSREKQIDAALAALAKELGVAQGAQGKQALRTARKNLEGEKARAQPFLDAIESSPASAIAPIMKIGKQRDLRYEYLSLDGKRIEIRGTAGDWNSREILLALVKRLGFSSATLDARNALANERIPFTIVSGGGHE